MLQENHTNLLKIQEDVLVRIFFRIFFLENMYFVSYLYIVKYYSKFYQKLKINILQTGFTCNLLTDESKRERWHASRQESVSGRDDGE